jgi:uncharacterized protein involved in response to NO
MAESDAAGRAAAGGIPRLRPWAGAPLLSYGFRPFFLAAGVSAPLALLVWLGVIAHGLAPPTAFSPAAWHAHEMLFGFAMAAVAGFLLTAVPNWTGRMPLNGWPLAALAGLWLAGRLAVAFGGRLGAAAAAALDLAFPLVLLTVILREVAAGRNWRNLPVCAALASLLLANLLMHLEPLAIAGSAALGHRLGIATLALLVALIGGRIVPSFTTNWLKRHGARSLPAPFGTVDKAALALALAALLAWVASPQGWPVGMLLLAAGAAQAARLVRWQGHRTLAEPLLWVLHLGYGWLALGVALIGVDAWTGRFGAHLHALTVGCFGTMILAVMSRATLGHTGRALTAGRTTTAIYVFVTLAAVLRVAADTASGAYLTLVALSGLAWITAFAIFLIVYGPMLLARRAAGPIP